VLSPLLFDSPCSTPPESSYYCSLFSERWGYQIPNDRINMLIPFRQALFVTKPGNVMFCFLPFSCMPSVFYDFGLATPCIHHLFALVRSFSIGPPHKFKSCSRGHSFSNDAGNSFWNPEWITTYQLLFSIWPQSFPQIFLAPARVGFFYRRSNKAVMPF